MSNEKVSSLGPIADAIRNAGTEKREGVESKPCSVVINKSNREDRHVEERRITILDGTYRTVGFVLWTDIHMFVSMADGRCATILMAHEYEPSAGLPVPLVDETLAFVEENINNGTFKFRKPAERDKDE